MFIFKFLLYYIYIILLDYICHTRRRRDPPRARMRCHRLNHVFLNMFKTCVFKHTRSYYYYHILRIMITFVWAGRYREADLFFLVYTPSYAVP